jgi:hypothetical protein
MDTQTAMSFILIDLERRASTGMMTQLGHEVAM